MATAPDMEWVHSGIHGGIEPGNRLVFGVIQEARVVEPGVSAIFVIACSDGNRIEDEFVYSLNPCETVGGLVKLELRPDNTVGARVFKAVADMLTAHTQNLAAEQRRRRSLDKRRDTLAEKERAWWGIWGQVRRPPG